MTEGRTLALGVARGRVLRLDEPLSFWGGIDPATGDVIDPRHPQRGESVKGRVVVMPGARGSSSSSSVLAEAVRAGVGPAAIVLLTPDPIIALGSIVARELYGVAVPVVLFPDAPTPGSFVDVRADPDVATIDVVGSSER